MNKPHTQAQTVDNGQLSATIFRFTQSELYVMCAHLRIRATRHDSKELLREKLLKAAGFKSPQQAHAQVRAFHLTEDQRLTLARAAIAAEVELLRMTADTLESLNNTTPPSAYWLANQSQSEIRYAHSKTNIAKLITLTKTEES